MYRSYKPHPNYVHTNITNTTGDQFRVYISVPRTWKGTKGLSDISNNVTNSVAPTNSRPPLIPVSGSGFLYRRDKHTAAPNPLRHWRRQLQPSQGSRTGRVSVGQVMDRPGGSVVLTYYQTIYNNGNNNNNNDCTSCQPFLPAYMLENYVRPLDPANCFQKTTDIYGPVTTVPNIICDPARITRPATTNLSKKYYATGKAYLRSRAKLWEQNRTLGRIPGNTYSTNQGQPVATDNYVPPTPTPTTNTGECGTGSQAYYNSSATDRVVDIVYKPSNYLFGVDGGVSSSDRIARLKYDAVKKNTIQTTALLADILAGSTPQLYRPDTDAPYFIKSKYQATVPCNPRSRAQKISWRMPAGGTGLKLVCLPVKTA